jgi:hypothetical protein
VSAPGFARLIDAVKGIGKIVDFFVEEDAKASVKVLPEAGTHCPSPVPAGYRCVLREPHAQCIVEKVR